MKWVVSVGSVTLFAVGAFFLGKFLFWPERLNTRLADQVDVDFSLQGIALSQGRDGKKLWDLKARAARYEEATDELILDDPVITYWGERGERPIGVRAPRGQVWQSENRARMWGGVNASHEEYIMRSRALDYNGSSDELLFSGDVQIVGLSMMASCNSVVYSLPSGDFFARGNVFVILQ